MFGTQHRNDDDDDDDGGAAISTKVSRRRRAGGGHKSSSSCRRYGALESCRLTRVSLWRTGQSSDTHGTWRSAQPPQFLQIYATERAREATTVRTRRPLGTFLRHRTSSSRSCSLSRCLMSCWRVTATRWGHARQRAHTPSWVSSSHTGQWSVVKYCEMVPFLATPSPPPPDEHEAFWIWTQRGCCRRMRPGTTSQGSEVSKVSIFVVSTRQEEYLWIFYMLCLCVTGQQLVHIHANFLLAFTHTIR